MSRTGLPHCGKWATGIRDRGYLGLIRPFWPAVRSPWRTAARTQQQPPRRAQTTRLPRLIIRFCQPGPRLQLDRPLNGPGGSAPPNRAGGTAAARTAGRAPLRALIQRQRHPQTCDKAHSRRSRNCLAWRHEASRFGRRHLRQAVAAGRAGGQTETADRAAAHAAGSAASKIEGERTRTTPGDALWDGRPQKQGAGMRGTGDPESPRRKGKL